MKIKLTVFSILYGYSEIFSQGFNWEKHCIGDKVHPIPKR
jgi:hypothetical protein